jgi:GTPase involved in cell partitioning and DNA repair
MPDNFRRFENVPEIVGGQIPIEDLPNWVENLSHGAGKLSKDELKTFTDTHVVKNVIKFAREGVDKEECLSLIRKELSSAGLSLTDAGNLYIKNSVDAVYELIKKYQDN